ncbi:MAG: immunoglobulin domain-containing protein, partial [Roseimicrobium sp.]
MNAPIFVSRFSRVRRLAVGLLGALFLATSQAEVQIVTTPQPWTVAPGLSAELEVEATGVHPLTYQWFRNGFPVATATGASHTISRVDEATTGVWSVKVTDGTGHFAFAFCRVANPGAVMQFVEGRPVAGGGNASAAAVPVALAEGDVSYAITNVGGLLWTDYGTDSGYDVTLPVLETPPPGSQPANLGPVVQIAAHGNRVVVLLADGTVRAWTRTKLDWESPPGGTWGHTPLALPPDAARGKWVFIDESSLWVARWDGTVAVVSDSADPLANLPPGLSQVVAIVTGNHLTGANPNTYGMNRHALALREDGTVVAWGANNHGQTEVPPGLDEVVQVTAAMGWSLARQRNGTLVQWGAQQTASAGGPPLVPTLPPPGAYRSIRAAGSGMAFALRDDGAMEAWLPLTPALTVYSGRLMPPPEVREVLDFGDRWNGGLARYLKTALCRAAAPVMVQQPESRSAFAGETVFLSVEATGRPLPAYQWFKGTAEVPGATTAELKVTNFTSADAGSYTVKVTNLHGEVTSAHAVLSLASGPEITTQPQNAALRPGGSTTLSVTASGSGALTHRWFKNGRVIPGAASSTLAIPSGLPVDAGVYQAEITDANGTRRSHLVRVGEGCSPTGWHDGASASYLEAVQHSPGEVFLALSEGEGWLGIGADGKLGWFYERVSFGESSGYAPSPLSFPSPSESLQVVSAAARDGLAVAVDRAGTISAWESSTFPYCVTTLSIGSTASSCSPYKIQRPLSVPAIAHGAIAVSISAEGEALALRADGRVISWSVFSNALTSVPTTLSAHVIAISSGKDHHLALKDDGTVIAWGDNAEGEGTVPTGLANVTGIAALEDASFAILADGAVVAWGDNSMGETDVPAALTGVASIRGARGTVLATKNDGTLVVWGTGAASTLPATLTTVRAAAVMPIKPPPTGGIVWSGVGGSLTSYGVALVPVAAPMVTAWSYIQRVFPGYSGNIAAASVQSFPSGPLTGRWLRNGVPLASTETSVSNTTLSLTHVTANDEGEYRMQYDNGWQTALSNPVHLEVAQPRLFSNWQAENFTPAERAAGLDAPGADPGGFGITNLMCYALGLHPHSPNMAQLPQP